MLTTILLVGVRLTDSLTLSAALSLARANRPMMRAAAATVAEARAQLRTAGAIPNPAVGYSHTEDTPREHLTVQQPFDWLLRRGSERAAAASGVTRARADSTRSAAELVAEVRRAFYGALAAREALRLIESEALVADSLAVLSGRRLAQGDIAAMEHDRIRLEAARVRQLVTKARAALAGQALALRRAIAWTDSGPLPDLSGTLGDGLERALVGFSRPAVAALPVVAMARADSVAATWRARGVRRGRLPMPGIEFGADWADPALPGRTLWLFGLSVPLPLWNQNGGELAAARARGDQANALLAETRLEAERQVAGAQLRLRDAATRAIAARDSLVPAGRRLRAQAVLAYQLGETGVLPVLDALRAEREIESAALEDLLVFQEALASWYALTGAGD